VTFVGYPEAPRYVSLVRCLTGDEEIVPPGLILEADRPEWAYCKREQLWAGAIGFGASAANFNQVAIGTAGGVLSYLHVITHVLSTIDANMGIVTIGGTAGQRTIVCRDTGFGSGTTPAFAGFFFKQAPGQLLANGWRLQAGVLQVVPPFISRSIGVPVIESTIVNVAQTLWVAGYSRKLRPEEEPDR